MNFTLRVVASALARPARRLRYGAHRDQVADLFLPDGEPRGLVVTLHGGWWQARRTRTKLYLRPLAFDLTAHGFAVLNAEYRRVGGGGGWPATFEDARAVVALAHEHAGGGRVAVLGHSAGAHLALYAAAQGGLDAVVALAAPSDLEARPGPETIAERRRDRHQHVGSCHVVNARRGPSRPRHCAGVVVRRPG